MHNTQLHHRLDAYRVALALFAEVERIAGAFPRGHADLKDQIRRAAAATVRHIAKKGASRMHPKDKAARFSVARGECAECSASLDMAEVTEIIRRDDAIRLRRLAFRVSRMLQGLIRRQRARADE